MTIGFAERRCRDDFKITAMTHSGRDPHDPDVEWIVSTRDWGTWLEPVATVEEAMYLLSRRIGGDPIYARQWKSKGS